MVSENKRAAVSVPAALINKKDQAFSIFLMVKVNLPAGTS